MRFRRSIIASLAPLIGLSALLAAASADTGGSSVKPLIRLLQSRLLQSVAQLTAPSSDYAVPRTPHEREAAQQLLEFSALAVTPLGRSLWMVAQRPSIDLLTRRHLLVPLRC
jgi:hypothetical protein